MIAPPRVKRVILVVLDGLRSDAVDTFGLVHLQRLAIRGASSFSGTTVSPSVTAAAMGSLLTGVAPAVHGLTSDRFHLPRPRRPLDPLPRVLARAGLPASMFLGDVPFVYRGLARCLTSALGFDAARWRGRTAPDVLDAASATLDRQRAGLVVLHWGDADGAGHAHGWMSAEYGVAARRLDATLGVLVGRAGVDSDDDETLLIALADHGGGGVTARDHDSAHPLDRTIPLVLAGAGVTPGARLDAPSLLDVPATICWVLDVGVPSGYDGRPLMAAFAGEPSEDLALVGAAG